MKLLTLQDSMVRLHFWRYHVVESQDMELWGWFGQNASSLLTSIHSDGRSYPHYWRIQEIVSLTNVCATGATVMSGLERYLQWLNSGVNIVEKSITFILTSVCIQGFTPSCSSLRMERKQRHWSFLHFNCTLQVCISMPSVTITEELRIGDL